MDCKLPSRPIQNVFLIPTVGVNTVNALDIPVNDELGTPPFDCPLKSSEIPHFDASKRIVAILLPSHAFFV